VTKEFVLGPHTIKVMCLQASSTDFDLTGQLIWPGAELLNNYLVQNFHILQGLSVIELGSGVGLTGLLCAHYCHHVVMTDHNATILKVMQRNVDSQTAVGGGGHIFQHHFCPMHLPVACKLENLLTLAIDKSTFMKNLQAFWIHR
jgi:predicted nicotinamide N-methyase